MQPNKNSYLSDIYMIKLFYKNECQSHKKCLQHHLVSHIHYEFCPMISF
ncbi:hypothetical protein VCHA28FP16_30285 [Vibrio chagasii]|nr:hypothetical protein VCHA28FP16_30285 [Vibrio chagasii]